MTDANTHDHQYDRSDRMRSQHPDDIAWREEQALRNLAIEGMAPRPEHVKEARRRRANGESVDSILGDMLARIAAEDRSARKSLPKGAE